MNETIDKLILLIATTIFMSLSLIIYKYAHVVFYPSSKQQIFKRFFPSRNAADTLHLFARIIGIGLIYSELTMSFTDGWLLAFITFFIQAIIMFIIYLTSIYIVESIVFYNFEYIDEILKRKNFTYAMISFSQTIAIGGILKTVLAVSEQNFIMLILLWLISMVILGFAIKSYSILSHMSFNKLLIQKNMSLAFSYTGFILGWALIITSALENESKDFLWFNLHVILRILLAIIIFPIFKWSLIKIFNLQDDFKPETISEDGKEILGPPIGYGLYEGIIFLTTCLLTTVITGKIYFGSFYPGT